jgi:hypothetical protein
MNKKVFEDDLISGMHQELIKQATGDVPDLSKAAECLHAALEIFEEQGLNKQADQILQVLQKIAQKEPSRHHAVQNMPSLAKLMEAGLTQRDLMEFSKGNPIAKAKFNLVLRSLGLSEHNMVKMLGPGNLMSEKEAKELVDPNRSYSNIWKWLKDPTSTTYPDKIQPGETVQLQSVLPPKEPPRSPSGTLEFKSIAQKKHVDPATKGLTPAKEVRNLLQHGHPLNVTMADDAVSVPPRRDRISKEDMLPEFEELLDSPHFDIEASDDELMGMEIKEDSLEVYDEASMADFEDERD